MGERVRDLLTKPSRRPLVRATITPPVLTAGLLRLVEQVRAADEPGPRCAAPCCVRRPMPSGPLCNVCARHGGNPSGVELLAAGWTPAIARGRRRGWRDPITGAVVDTKTAALMLRRDGARRPA